MGNSQWGIERNSTNTNDKVTNELRSMIQMLNQWMTPGKTLKEREEDLNYAMSRFPPSGYESWTQDEQNKFNKIMQAYIQNPRSVNYNNNSKSYVITQGGKRKTKKTRKHMKKRVSKKLKSRKAH